MKNFSVQYEKSNNKIKNFFEEIKTKQRKEENTINELRQKRENKENLYEEEKLLNKKLYETLESKIREIYILKRYGSFFHKIMETKFIYDRTPEIKIREKNFEIIGDIIIDIYENEDKYIKFT